MSGLERTPSVWSLPWRTVRLAGRCILPLLIWYALGRLVRFGLLVGGTEMSHGDWEQVRYALTMLVFIVMVMVNLIVTIGMFHALRGELTEMRLRRAEGERDESFLNGLGRALFPYVALYLAWGWHEDDVRSFVLTDIERQRAEKGLLGAWADFFTGESQGTAQGLIGLSLGTAAIIMGVAFVLRFFLVMWHERRGNRGAAIGAAFCELTFFYYGAGVLLAQREWVGERQIAKWWNDAWDSLEVNLPGWKVTMEFLGELRPYAWDALVLPAAWLTVAIVVYGAYAEDVRTVIRGTRLETGADRAERALQRRTHALTREGLSRFFGRWAHWVALANTVRLTVRGGAPLFGMFAVCFVAIRVAEGYLWRGLHYLLDGPHPQLWWEVLWVPMGFVCDLLVTLLTICLLAATFDLAAIRGRVLAGGSTEASSATPPAAAVPAVPAGSSTGAAIGAPMGPSSGGSGAAPGPAPPNR
ncbi:hypothetical protein [Thermopolyspora flexuosa]|nr:hypothetical protein [Thermopolyspora flexuosa]